MIINENIIKTKKIEINSQKFAKFKKKRNDFNAKFLKIFELKSISLNETNLFILQNFCYVNSFFSKLILSFFYFLLFISF